MTATIAAKWRAAAWTVIPETVETPAMHVALDEALMTTVAAGRRGPTLRFWAWAAPAVIIGRFQSVRNEVDLEAAKDLDVTVVRRLSGGGAMYVRPGAAVTYSLYVPTDMLEGISIRESYEFCDTWAVAALRGLGADVRYVPLNDIATDTGKVGGAAQARRPGVVMHHTTLAYRMDGTEMLRVLRIGREKLVDKGIASAAKRVHPLAEQLAQPREEIVQHLLAGFRTTYGGDIGAITADELKTATELARTRYATDAWTRGWE